MQQTAVGVLKTRFIFLASDQTTELQCESWEMDFFSVITDHHQAVLRTAVVTQAKYVRVESHSERLSFSESEVHAIEWLVSALEVLGIELLEYEICSSTNQKCSASSAGILTTK